MCLIVSFLPVLPNVSLGNFEGPMSAAFFLNMPFSFTMKMFRFHVFESTCSSLWETLFGSAFSKQASMQTRKAAMKTYQVFFFRMQVRYHMFQSAGPCEIKRGLK